MGCSQSSEIEVQNPVCLLSSRYLAYTFSNKKSLKTTIQFKQTANQFPLHVIIESLASKGQRWVIGKFLQDNKKCQFPIEVPGGQYKMHVITSRQNSQPIQVKISDANVVLKPFQGGLNKEFLDLTSNLCKSKGESIKQQGVKTSLYHEPQSNLVIVCASNTGQQVKKYNIVLTQCKQRQKYSLLQTQISPQTTTWTQSIQVNKDQDKVWLIAPVVPYNKGLINKWQISQSVLGKATAQMMEIGAGFDHPMNPPPDIL